MRERERAALGAAASALARRVTAAAPTAPASRFVSRLLLLALLSVRCETSIDHPQASPWGLAFQRPQAARPSDLFAAIGDSNI